MFFVKNIKRLLIILIIISLSTLVSAQDMFLEVANYSDGQVEITMSNTEDVGGFQMQHLLISWLTALQVVLQKMLVL